MIEQALLQELKRFNAINKYTETLYEQAEPATPPPGQEAGLPPELAGAGAPPPPETPTDASAMPDAGTETPATPPEADTTSDDSTEELDITDLVNMTKSIKKQLETSQTDNGSVIQKMDGAFSKLAELETKLGEMDNILAKIDELGAKVEQMRPPTPVEKLEMRSLDSYPFNQKPDEFFAQKQQEMRQSGKNEYVLTKDDVQNYGKEQISKSFNPDSQEFQTPRY